MKLVLFYSNLLFLFFVLELQPVCAQRQTLRVMTWNVENLFDCRDDSLTNDEEFLPDAERKWTWGRYWKKIESLGRVILAVGIEEPVDLIGLCEVENDSVLYDLTKKGLLSALSYRYVVTTSPDQRGVDVALLYQPARFRLLDWHAVRIPSKENNFPPTRDILWAKGITFQRDTLHVIVCHFPSRMNGKQNERHRRLASHTLGAIIDSIGTDKHILAMGDFNAQPKDPVFKTLDMLNDCVPQNRYPKIGSYYFRGTWSWIDHILVSASLLQRSTSPSPYCASWMCSGDSQGFWRPRRTYLGTYYNGGVSDHLPIWMDINP